MSRNWTPEVHKQVNELEWLWGKRCETYPGHGTTGERYGIDIVTNEGRRWNDAEEHEWALHILAWLKGNWSRLGIIYAIYNDRIYWSPTSWTWYNWKSYGRGLQIEAVQRHGNHLHIQLPHGFFYEPPHKYP